MYKIGVVIPVYHGRGRVEKALDSLVTQTFKDFEVCLGVDCDGESYEDIITEYVRRGLTINCRIRPYRGGPGMARQSGINMLIDECEYLVFMDQDDVMMPMGLQYAYDAIEDDIDVCQCTFIEESKNQYVLHEGATSPVTYIHAKIYRSQFLKENNICFTDKVFWNEDCYFNVVAMNVGRCARVNTAPLYLWRYNNKSATHENFTEFFTKAWDTFALSQVLAILKIEEVAPERLTPTACGAITREIYIHCQNGIANGQDESRVYKWLDMLKTSERYLATLKTPEFWKAMLQLRNYVYYNATEDKNFIPTENILEWVKRLISTEVWDDIYC